MPQPPIDLKFLPTQPGIYLYRDRSGRLIYVGKAINLQKRISSYFKRPDALGAKTGSLVSQIATIETKVVDSEIEALILEAKYIKRYHPKFNSLLADDRNYPFICITKDPIPRVISCFFSTIPDNSLLYGPFPSGYAIRSILRTIRTVFPFRSAKNHPKTKCLYCHLGICPGPSPDPKSYRKTIGIIKKILNGNIQLLQRHLKKLIRQASSDLDFEKAIVYRDRLLAINYIVTGWHQLSHLYQNITPANDSLLKAVLELESVLKPANPNLSAIKRIECFDISNLGNKYFVGSMVVFANSQIDKSQYRQFKIYSKLTQDDQFMIKEVIFRRLNHPEWPYPELIVVDGGKPQVSAAHQALALQSLANTSHISVLGLAKKHETIVIKTANNWLEINLPPNSAPLHLLERLRDEAHRFANRYRRLLYKKSISKPSSVSS
ncbi:MAG: GIY-YIG nuclease family protein [Candidatus Shapirobacteria bacterium]|jgi:excinuclease ABC subunit C